MNETPPLPLPNFKDRSTGLMVFGILEILLGALFALFLLAIVGMLLIGPARPEVGAPDAKMMLPGVLVYAILSATFISLGIGSIRARRWARALSLVMAAMWLVMGVCAFAGLLLMLPQLLQTMTPKDASLPPAFAGIMLTVMVVIWSVMFLVMPGVLTFFYRSPHVKATCEARDPQRRWTDACPLPVLGLSLLLGFGALMMLLTPVISNGVLPFFGVLISGFPGAAAMLMLAAVWAWCARGIYRLDPTAWWVLLVLICAFFTSNLITFSRVEIVEMYRLMGYPEAQIELMQQSLFVTNKNMLIWSGCPFLLFIGFLVYVKKFFRRPA